MARAFLDWLDVPGSLRWLDVGCGTGALSAAIRDKCRPARIIGVDPSGGFLDKARVRLAGDATLITGGASDLPLREGQVDVVVSGLALNFFPDPARGLREMRRVATVGGTIAAYVWDYSGKMELMRHFWDVAVELDEAARVLDEGQRFPVCRPVALTNLFGAAGLADVSLMPIDVATRFLDFDDYWAPFLGGQGPAPSYAMSMDEAARLRLRDRIRQRIPVEPDGTISLVARAWAVRGRVPA